MISCDEILPGLILGSRDAAENPGVLNDMNITHILTIDIAPIPSSKRVTKIIYHFIQADDAPWADLLSHFEETFLFINGALNTKRSRCYVHCFAGISRSSTVVIAYLMKRDCLTFAEALRAVKNCRNICPNPGFQAQLKLYESMDCRVCVNNMEYREFKLAVLIEELREKHVGDMGVLRKSLRRFIDEIGQLKEGFTIYKCKKCRNNLFGSEHIFTHSSAESYPWNRRLNFVVDGPECHLSLFVQPLIWMLPNIDDIQGKLLCPVCKAKVGKYSCLGIQCSCGKKMSLSFWMNENKLDNCSTLLPSFKL